MSSIRISAPGLRELEISLPQFKKLERIIECPALEKFYFILGKVESVNIPDIAGTCSLMRCKEAHIYLPETYFESTHSTFRDVLPGSKKKYSFIFFYEELSFIIRSICT